MPSSAIFPNIPPQAAQNILDDIYRSIDQLAFFPNLGQQVDGESFRRIATLKFHFTIGYEVTTDSVNIVGIFRHQDREVRKVTARIFLAAYLLSVVLADITLQWIGRMNYPKSWDLLLGFYGFPQMVLAGLLHLYLESPLLSSFVALIGIAALVVLLSYAYRKLLQRSR